MAKAETRIGFIGAGRAGSALATGLTAAGYPIAAVYSRTADSARRVAARLPGCITARSARDVARSADLVFVTTPDAAIRSVVGAMNWRASQAVVHTSGALSTDVLESAARQGAAVGSLHPLQTFAGDEDDHRKLRGSVFGVEAEGDLRETLLEIVQDLGGTAIELRGEDKVLYHAAAVLVSNYTVTLMKLATDLWLRLGWERPAAVNALLPLLQGTVDNLARSGVPAALTGPIARGDVETVERHLEALGKAAPDIVAAYRELAIQAIPVALAGGTLSNSSALLLRGLLEAKPDTATSEGAKT